MKENTESKNPEDHILSGIDEIARAWLKDFPANAKLLPLEEMFSCIDKNFKPSRKLDNLSEKNWRFEKILYIDPDHKGPETVLEKRISLFTDDKPAKQIKWDNDLKWGDQIKWANQVPTSSGFRGKGGGKRNIDLVFARSESSFVFYELKVLRGSDGSGKKPQFDKAFDAAIELLGYGLLYIYSRTFHPCYLTSPLMQATIKNIYLRILGTWDYYELQKSNPTGASIELQDIISNSLNDFASTHSLKFRLDFRFDTFPQNFLWSVKDKEDKDKILAAVQGIRPLFS